MSRSRSACRPIAALTLVLSAGCYQFEPNAALAGKDPATTPHAMVCDADGVRCTAINGQPMREHFRITLGKGDSSERYLVPAGPCVLNCEFSNNAGNMVVRGDGKTLRFTAVEGHTYTLNSYVKPWAVNDLSAKAWDARLHDDAEPDKSVWVAQTTDVPR